MPLSDFSKKLVKEGKLAHIAIIMDGNGRWAKKHALPKKKGHMEGINALHRIIDGAISIGLPYLTVYAFSAENINRPQHEVKDLFGILRYYMEKEAASLIEKNIRVRVIGDLSLFDKGIVSSLRELETKTARATGLHLTVALGYGGRQELVRAAKKMTQDVQSGTLSPHYIDETCFASYLESGHMPDPDFLIRTSGEMRLSNFLLWKMAYTELYFTDCLWPDFNEAMFEKAIIEFSKRERRFGR